MNIVFRIELDKGAADAAFDPAALEITRDAHNNIVFTVVNGLNRPILKGNCEPDELFKLTTTLTDGET